MSLLKKIQLASALCFSLLMNQHVSSASTHHQAVSNAVYEQQILHYVNAYRAKYHLKPLTINHRISHEAAMHSRAMATHNTGFGHQGFSGRIKRLYQQIKPCRGGAENVAYYRLSPKQLVDAWMKSAGHRRNILGPYNLTGIGIAHAKTGWAYFTQIFLRYDPSSTPKKIFKINLM